MILTKRGGRHYRVCDPDWIDCLDTSFAKRDGARWNAPGSFGVLHLCATIDVAAANARKHYEGEIHTLFDLEPAFQPILMQVNVRLSEFVDCASDAGLRSAGLPSSYPDGVTWVRTRDVGRRAYAQPNANGIACRSAVLPEREELAVFDRAIGVVRRGKQFAFGDWYPPLRASGLKREVL
ncbi:MAG: RES family NAD+ phosphorylase [Candidatus Eremiobacteraeota bacterium]|nr:RES family NAD+ phosphorylase [Candidatus Eremiobacteraeota bacterium]